MKSQDLNSMLQGLLKACDEAKTLVEEIHLLGGASAGVSYFDEKFKILVRLIERVKKSLDS